MSLDSTKGHSDTGELQHSETSCFKCYCLIAMPFTGWSATVYTNHFKRTLGHQWVFVHSKVTMKVQASIKHCSAIHNALLNRPPDLCLLGS